MSRSIWNMTHTSYDSESVYCLFGNQKNPQFYLCERFITKDYKFEEFWCFNEIVSVDSSLFYGKELLDKEQIRDTMISPDKQILCVYCLLDENGDTDGEAVPGIGAELTDFEFCGFDLADIHPISALLNCGFGFEKVFTKSDLNKFGLISDYCRAKDIQQRLMNEYNDSNHAYTALFAVWRKV